MDVMDHRIQKLNDYNNLLEIRETIIEKAVQLNQLLKVRVAAENGAFMVFTPEQLQNPFVKETKEPHGKFTEKYTLYKFKWNPVPDEI